MLCWCDHTSQDKYNVDVLKLADYTIQDKCNVDVLHLANHTGRDKCNINLYFGSCTYISLCAELNILIVDDFKVGLSMEYQ